MGEEGTALRAVRVWRVLLGVRHTVVEGVEPQTTPRGEVLVARVRPTRSRAGAVWSPRAPLARL